MLPYECTTTTTSRPCDVSAMIAFRAAVRSSRNVLDVVVVGQLEGRDTRTHLYPCASRGGATLSQVLGLCHDPWMKTNVGFEDIMGGF